MTKHKRLTKTANHARFLIIDTLIHAGVGHPGGALSSIDVMTALYFDVMNIDPKKPDWEERDRFILSKGHSCIALYAILSLKGFITKDELRTFRQDGSNLGGHLDLHKTPGVEMSTGSLGHGLSVGVGRALAGKIDEKKYRVFVLMGDGETQEGSIWEAAMSAAHYKLDNLIGIVDRNQIQIDGHTEDIMSLEPYAAKWKSFGWAVEEINGHDMGEIIRVLKKVPFYPNKPSLIISNTIKGKGISFMENTAKWHGGAPHGELADKAKEEVAPYCPSKK